MRIFNNLLLYTGSKVTRSSDRFTLADLDTAMSKDRLEVKKEKSSASLPRKMSTVNLTMKTLGSRKRKTAESTGLTLESLGA